jgi:hypothetical protein
LPQVFNNDIPATLIQAQPSIIVSGAGVLVPTGGGGYTYAQLTTSMTDWFKQDSIVPKVPNWALAGLGGLALLAFSMPGGGKKRRKR